MKLHCISNSLFIIYFLKSAIDLDVKEIETLLLDEKVEEAMEIYKEGSNTRPYADLTLEVDLPESINMHTNVYTTIVSSDVKSSKLSSERIAGLTMAAAKKGSNKLQILYEINDDPINFVNCKVGARQNPLLDGCFPESGNITIEQQNTNNNILQLPYKYNQYIDNKNDRSIQIFSSKAGIKNKPCSSCEYWTTYEKFRQYYGKTDYANQFITAAIIGSKITFDSGVYDFTNITLEGRTGKFFSNIKLHFVDVKSCKGFIVSLFNT